ncbi:DNA ligase D-like protein (predicted polymerase) [Motilibacter rhizosphaerae]|uniref:DNA ligase D-like protein (Predicted polymerase) n=1 Tax=Motilibacter rhizosphaerae TaxID=598652 RepID=A0A4Q7NAP5_9ACTN|nr:ATP-dependent DNA ligase [Motilibacter rhizosphaerae]RZS80008.1 DNA ligase D-like protein (predicted polymerase) [Motilibacter rhizosphaerae]
MPEQEERSGVRLTNLDQPLFADAGATKRDLVDYLEAVADRFVPVLAGRALSVVRVLRGQAPFVQKNLPAYAPESTRTLEVATQDGKRVVHYPVCDDRETLLWFANQRAVEYHPALFRGHDVDSASHLVLDVDPPAGTDSFARAVDGALLVRQALSAAGMDALVKTSGAKGVHVMVPLLPGQPVADVAAATRALAARAERIDPALATTAFVVEERGGRVFLDATRSGGATLAAAYSPRVRPGVPVSFPLAWDVLGEADPAGFTITSVPRLLGGADPWVALMPVPQQLDPALVEEGRAIPVARVAAMHEGKRRARARRAAEG